MTKSSHKIFLKNGKLFFQNRLWKVNSIYLFIKCGYNFEKQVELTLSFIFSEASLRALRQWNRGIGAQESEQIESITQPHEVPWFPKLCKNDEKAL